jgi:hypothetical protein
MEVISFLGRGVRTMEMKEGWVAVGGRSMRDFLGHWVAEK